MRAKDRLSRLSKKHENVCALRREANNAQIQTKDAQRSLKLSESRFILYLHRSLAPTNNVEINMYAGSNLLHPIIDER